MEHLKTASKRDVKAVFEACKNLVGVYRYHRKGWTNDKEKTMRHITSIPEWVYFDPEHSKYFDPRMGPEERRKSIDAWIKKNDWFRFDKSDGC